MAELHVVIKEYDRTEQANRQLSLRSLILSDLRVNPRNPKGFLLCFLYRIAHSVLSWPFYMRPLGYAYIAFYKLVTEYVLSTEIHWRATIGPEMHISHGYGLVVHSNAVIGRNVVFRHGVTVGVGHTKFTNGVPEVISDDVPIVGDRVEFGANSVVIGRITIGDGAVIGAGAIVVCSVPQNALAVGNPARIIIKSDENI